MGGLVGLIKIEIIFWIVTIYTSSYKMSSDYIYVVTKFGYNSTGSYGAGMHRDMWTPESKLFLSRDDAYKHFYKVAPPDGLGRLHVTRYAITIEECDDAIAKGDDNIIIEEIVQSFAESPYGAVIVATKVVG